MKKPILCSEFRSIVWGAFPICLAIACSWCAIAARAEEKPAEPPHAAGDEEKAGVFHAKSNDEWPESEA